ncbi:MAG: hypothetical protein ACRELA_00050 [Candidatus Rokuibacteriota bacterium]
MAWRAAKAGTGSAVQVVVGGAVALALMWGLGQSWRPDEWTRLIEIGDGLLASGGSEARDRADLAPRTVYLLAFHHAQDAADVARMLLVADRLDRLGETDLAQHVRLAALEAETTVAALPPRRE